MILMTIEALDTVDITSALEREKMHLAVLSQIGIKQMGRLLPASGTTQHDHKQSAQNGKDGR